MAPALTFQPRAPARSGETGHWTNACPNKAAGGGGGGGSYGGGKRKYGGGGGGW